MFVCYFTEFTSIFVFCFHLHFVWIFLFFFHSFPFHSFVIFYSSTCVYVNFERSVSLVRRRHKCRIDDFISFHSFFFFLFFFSLSAVEVYLLAVKICLPIISITEDFIWLSDIWFIFIHLWCSIFIASVPFHRIFVHLIFTWKMEEKKDCHRDRIRMISA